MNTESKLNEPFKRAYQAFLETKNPKLTDAEIEQAIAYFNESNRVKHISIEDLEKIQYLTELEITKYKKENEK